jgi:hypothetical protein
MSKYLLSKFLYTIDRDPARVCAETEPHQPALPRHLYVNEMMAVRIGQHSPAVPECHAAEKRSAGRAYARQCHRT